MRACNGCSTILRSIFYMPLTWWLFLHCHNRAIQCYVQSAARCKDPVEGQHYRRVFYCHTFYHRKIYYRFYIGNSKLGATYGAAASIVVILLWVYYTSIILYFGAEYTKIHAMEAGGGIAPDEQAVYIIKTESKEIPVSKDSSAKPGDSKTNS
jgi:hypothetical protein